MSSPDHGYLNATFDPADPNAVAAYDETWLWSARFGLMLLDRVPLKPGVAVLDIGCGTGFPLFALAAALGPGSTCIGIDPWSGALRRAASKRDAYGVQAYTHVIRADAALIPFADASFALVTSNLGINNFNAPEAAMRECARVLRPGGRIALTTNLQGHMAELYDVLRDLITERGDAEALARLDAHIAHRATIDSTRELLAGAGFVIETEHSENLCLRYANGSALLWHWFIRVGFLPAWRAIAGSGEQEVIGELEVRLNELAHREGTLTLTVPALYVAAVRPA